jgi:hypothetical protein
MRTAAVGLAILSLAGCAASPAVRTQVVRVPVPIVQPCRAPSVPARPALPIAALAATSSPAQVMRAYVVSVAMLEGYIEQLEALLGVRRETASPPVR